MPVTRRLHLAVLLLVLAAISLVYWPGLSGDYVFDDPANILNNEVLRITALDVDSLRGAFWSGDAGPLGRPLSMLSFALNHYATGFEPFYIKLTNLGIHLANTALVAWLAYALLCAFSQRQPDQGGYRPIWLALLAAALWGLHPLNLTSVLYAVQRMTSLSTLFGLIALSAYAWLRISPARSARPGLVTGVLLFVALALLASAFSKESGLLFIPLLIWIELLAFRFLLGDRPIRLGPFRLRDLVLLAGSVFTLAVVLFALPTHMDASNFLRRDFNLTERVLTETRVLFFYLRLLVYPSLPALGLYHDDFTISQSWLEPLSTLFSIAGLVSITLGCVALARRVPILLFAWGWFLIAHLLESTVFSLELVHEHRNYFAIIGPLLLVPYALLHLPVRWRATASGVTGVFLLLLAFVTWQRAEVWSNLVDHAAYEAATHPDSDRANYQMGRIYLKLLDQTGDKKYVALAKESFHRALASYKPANGAYFGLIHLAYYLDEEPAPNIVEALRQRLHDQPFHNSNVGFLNTFVTCQVERHCKLPDRKAVALLAAAVENPTATRALRAEVYKLLALYFIERLGDFPKGEEFLQDAIAEANHPSSHLLLAQAYRLQGKLSAASQALEAARNLNQNSVWQQRIEQESALQSAAKEENHAASN